jgi:hypothetical protein
MLDTIAIAAIDVKRIVRWSIEAGCGGIAAACALASTPLSQRVMPTPAP